MFKQLKISGALLLFLLALYQLLRLGFLIANAGFFHGSAAGEVMFAFVRGIRFDLSALLLLDGALLLLYNLPGNPARWRPFGFFLFTLFCAANIAGIVVNLADYGYFRETQRRLVGELFAMPRDIAGMVPGLLHGYWFLFLLLAVVAALFVYAALQLSRWLDRRIESRRNIITELISLVIIIPLLVLGVRGGLQSKPLRPAHAFRSTNWPVGYLTLNSTYTVLRGLAQVKLPEYQLMSEDRAAAIVAQMVKSPSETMIDPRYPFLRERVAAGPPRRRNVVIFIMESWVSEQMGCYGASTSCTPCFDSLARGGLLFTNFLANGQRSIEAAPAVLASVPGLSNNTQIGSTTETTRLLGLGTILAKRGYATAFYHGAKTGSMGFDAFARMAGFARYYGKEDYPNLTRGVQDGTWGLYDEPAFLDACARADGMAKPFCLAIYSLNPHVPFAIPASRDAAIPRFPGESEYQRALRYSDFSLGRFFAAARTKPWFDSTVFVIVGDHTTSPARHDFRSIFLVPCLVLAPGLVKPGRTARIGSQVDILPTVLDLLNLPAVHAATGRSLLDITRTHYAAEYYSGQVALFTDTLLALSWLSGPPEIYAYLHDPKLTRSLRRFDNAQTRELRDRLEGYLQASYMALRNDRVCRIDDLRPGQATSRSMIQPFERPGP